MRAYGGRELARGARCAAAGLGASVLRAQPFGCAGANDARNARGPRDGHDGTPGRHVRATDAATNDDDATSPATTSNDDAATDAVWDAWTPQRHAGRGRCRGALRILQLAHCSRLIRRGAPL